MTPELLRTIQTLLLFAVIWAEMVLLAIVISRYVLQKFPNVWIFTLVILVSVPALFYLTGNAFGVILGEIDLLKDRNSINQSAPGFFYIFAIFGAGIGFLLKVLFGAISSTVIWLVSLVVIRIRSTPEGSPT